jgi:LPS-assembly protein
MKFTSLGLAILFTAAGLARAEDLPGQPAAKPDDEVVLTSADGMGEVEMDRATGRATAQNGVVVRYQGSTLRAKTLILDQENHLVWAEGDVVIEGMDAQGNIQLWRGDKVRYDYVTRTIEADVFRVGQPPFFAAGEKLIGGRLATTQMATNAIVTTEDYADPAYKVRARTITFTSDRRIVAKDAVLYLAGVPVMYFPTYSKALDPHRNFWVVQPGYRGYYGAYLLSSYHYAWTTNVTSTLHLDYRTKRGFGLGPELTYDLGKWGEGNGSFYYAHDESPGEGQLNPAIVPEDRKRGTFTHQMSPWEDFTAKAVVRYWGDSEVERDFFENQFRHDTQPKSFLELNQAWRNFSLDAVAQPQINDFYQTIERLPDVKLTGLRQQIGESPLYYDSESSAAYLRRRKGPLGAGPDYEAMRADTYHQVTLPWTFFGWLNLTPRAGGRFTHYEETEDLNLSARDRWLFNTGAEVSFKASRVWQGARNELFEVDGLRHILEPSANYAYVPRPDKRPMELPQFDTTLPTYRLLPIEFPDYNAIDSIDSQNVVRLSLRNKLQTKRRGEVENLVNWSVYTDWRLKTLPGQDTFPDFYSELDFSPRSWIVLSSELRYGLSNDQWNEVNHRLTLLPNDTWNWTVGNRYLNSAQIPGGFGNNLYYSSLVVRLNENWAIRANHHFEGRDGTMEEQYYTLYRDLRSWTAGLTFRLRDNRAAGDEWAIALTFQLKAFPTFKLGEDGERAQYLMGGLR